MLASMFSGRLDVVKGTFHSNSLILNLETDRHGYYLIDRDGKYFGFILNYLR